MRLRLIRRRDREPTCTPNPPPRLGLDGWTCMVCQDYRPDGQIGVVHRPIRGMEGAFPATRANVRYCTDRPACAAAAQALTCWPPE